MTSIVNLKNTPFSLFSGGKQKNNNKKKVQQVRLVPSSTMRVPRLNFHTGYLRRTAGSLLGDGPEGVDSTLPTVRGRTSMAAWKLTDPELAQYPASQEISLTCYGE